MKILSIAVPCFNSEQYMEKCVDSLLAGGEDVEILIVDDGSTHPETLELARRYEERHPTIVRAIHQENKGHGGAVNCGLAHAEGRYFKVVDSDDWVDEKAYQRILSALKAIEAEGKSADVLLSNYIYDNVLMNHQYVMKYKGYLPEGRIFGWDEVKDLSLDTYVLMHSIIYETSFLRDRVRLRLPEHTFYVDNIFAFVPFSEVKSLYYLDVDFYHYFIGRADQSVNIDVMKKRADQQYRVNDEMIRYMRTVEHLHPHQEQWMIHYLTIIMMVTTVLYVQIGDREPVKQLWNLLKETSPRTYRKISRGVMGRIMHLPGKFGGDIIRIGYDIAQKRFGFN